MKKVWILLILPALLSGCAAEETLETIADDIAQPVMAQPAQISVDLPDNAVAPVLESDAEQVYLSEEYEIIIETVSAGDLSATVQRISGYTPDNLTVMETEQVKVPTSSLNANSSRLHTMPTSPDRVPMAARTLGFSVLSASLTKR